MHLVTAEHAKHRIIDGERACLAIDALDSSPDIPTRAAQFAILGDPTRLAVLTCIQAAGPISVSDLSAATGISDTTVSQTLRHLRAAEIVAGERKGRVVRYRLKDDCIARLIRSGDRSARTRSRNASAGMPR